MGFTVNESAMQAAADRVTTVIEPNRAWFRIPWRETWRYRDLIGLLVRRDFVATYKQTVLGPLWYVIQPLFQTVVFTIIFGKLANLPTDGMPKPVFYLCGTLAWSYFARCLSGTSMVLRGNAGLFGKVYFPRLVIPIASVTTGLIGFLIQLGTFLLVWGYFKLFVPSGANLQISAWVLLVPLCLLICAATGMGVGLWVSALSCKYRDVNMIFQFVVRFWMYATPVVYPLSLVPERWRGLISLNPMTSITEFYRFAFLGQGTLSLPYFALSALTAVLFLLSGIVVFSRAERTFIDTV